MQTERNPDMFEVARVEGGPPRLTAATSATIGGAAVPPSSDPFNGSPTTAPGGRQRTGAARAYGPTFSDPENPYASEHQLGTTDRAHR